MQALEALRDPLPAPPRDPADGHAATVSARLSHTGTLPLHGHKLWIHSQGKSGA